MSTIFTISTTVWGESEIFCLFSFFLPIFFVFYILSKKLPFFCNGRVSLRENRRLTSMLLNLHFHWKLIERLNFAKNVEINWFNSKNLRTNKNIAQVQNCPEIKNLISLVMVIAVFGNGLFLTEFPFDRHNLTTKWKPRWVLGAEWKPRWVCLGPSENQDERVGSSENQDECAWGRVKTKMVASRAEWKIRWLLGADWKPRRLRVGPSENQDGCE